MVVERHLGTLLDEEEDQTVVLTPFYCDTIELALEMVGVVWSLDSKLIDADVVHLLDESLAARVMPSVVKEFDAVPCLPGPQAHLLYDVDKGLHDEWSSLNDINIINKNLV
jgi:hypothetical protein